MKKLVICICALCFFAAGCGRKQETKAGFTVMTSFYPVYIVAKNITQDVPGVLALNMTPPLTGCLHDYSMTTEDMKHLEKGNLFLINGAGMESFTDKVAQKFPSLKTAELSTGIPLIRDGEGNVNPHVWVSVTNMIMMTHTCADILAARDSEHAAQYRENEKKYAAALASLKAEMDREMKPFKGKKIVTFHEAFPYFAKEYGLVTAAVIEREPGSEPSAKELSVTIDTVRAAGVKVLFAEPQYPSSAAEAVARETGATVYTLDPAVTGEDRADAYLDIMKKNLGVLKSAFAKQK
jgi:zinc transport system substrate-binding protein